MLMILLMMVAIGANAESSTEEIEIGKFNNETTVSYLVADGLVAARQLVNSLSDPEKMNRVTEELTRICGVNVASLATLAPLVLQLLGRQILQIPMAIEAALIAVIRFVFALGNGAVTGLLAFIFQLGVLLSTAIARLLAALSLNNNGLLQQILRLIFGNRPLLALLSVPLLAALVALGLKLALAAGIALPIAIPLGLHGHDDSYEYNPPSYSYDYDSTVPTGRPIQYASSSSPYYYAASASYYNYTTTPPPPVPTTPYYNPLYYHHNSRTAAAKGPNEQHYTNALIDDWQPLIDRRNGQFDDNFTNTKKKQQTPRILMMTKSIKILKSLLAASSSNK